MRYITVGEYHKDMGQFYMPKNRPAYKNYGNFQTEDIDVSEVNYGLSIKEICNIREICGNYKYTYDENYDLQDFCTRNGRDNLVLCMALESCKK